MYFYDSFLFSFFLNEPLQGLSEVQTRANILRGCKLGGSRSGEVEENSRPEVVNAEDCPGGNGFDIAECDSLWMTPTKLKALCQKGMEEAKVNVCLLSFLSRRISFQGLSYRLRYINC